jgi:hypothetical protein
MFGNHKIDSPDPVCVGGVVINPDVDTRPVPAAADEEGFGCVNVSQGSALRRCVIVVVRSIVSPQEFLKHEEKNILKKYVVRMVNIRTVNQSLVLL